MLRNRDLSPATPALPSALVETLFRDPITHQVIHDPVITFDQDILERDSALSKSKKEFVPALPHLLEAGQRDPTDERDFGRESFVRFSTLRSILESYHTWQQQSPRAPWQLPEEALHDCISLVPLSTPLVLLDGRAYQASTIAEWQVNCARENRPFRSLVDGTILPHIHLECPTFAEFCEKVGIAQQDPRAAYEQKLTELWQAQTAPPTLPRAEDARYAAAYENREYWKVSACVGLIGGAIGGIICMKAAAATIAVSTFVSCVGTTIGCRRMLPHWEVPDEENRRPQRRGEPTVQQILER